MGTKLPWQNTSLVSTTLWVLTAQNHDVVAHTCNPQLHIKTVSCASVRPYLRIKEVKFVPDIFFSYENLYTHIHTCNYESRGEEGTSRRGAEAAEGWKRVN